MARWPHIVHVILVLTVPAFSTDNGSVYERCRQLIPSPMSVRVGTGVFEFSSTTALEFVPEARLAVEELQRRFSMAAGFHWAGVAEGPMPSVIFLIDTTICSLGPSSYALTITERRVTIRSWSPAGFFAAAQTLLQLLPPEIMSRDLHATPKWEVACVSITDAPKYEWRSFMLDSGRQFQTVEFIKRYLDLLAMFKIETFHWHLTEGQGWRVEIKRYPKLTEIGSRVASGPEQQGFYTRSEIREVVEYARQRCINVVPEIDVPGHAEAALIAYPEHSCRGQKPVSVMEYSATLFCAGRESTYVFLQNVLDEVCELFPGSYIHLGGDEAPKEEWDACPACQDRMRAEGLSTSHELQVSFSSRLARYLAQKGKKVILWGDVVEQPGGRLPENVIVYWWNVRKQGDAAYRAAIREGYPVICGTNIATYLNYPVTPWSKYREDRTFDLRDAYERNPSDLARPAANVLGMGTCLWTDWHVTMRMADQRVFPRLLALAEQMWSRGERRSFEDFTDAVRSLQRRLEFMGVRPGPAMREDVPKDYSWD